MSSILDVKLRWNLLLIVATALIQTRGHSLTAPTAYVTEGDCSNNCTQSALNDIRLTKTKIGLAAAFFFAVLISCGSPIVIIHWLQKTNVEKSKQTEPPDCNSNNDTNMNLSCSPNRVVNPMIEISSGSVGAVNSTTNMSSSPIQGNIDLLTGKLVRGNSDRRRSRQSLGVSRDLLAIGGVSDTYSHPRTPTTAQQSQYLASCGNEARKLLLRLWFSRCNCFAAGIFLSSGFMELYPDVEEAINTAKQRLQIERKFPFAPFLTLCGFFLVLSMEQIVITVKMTRDARLHQENQQKNHNQFQRTNDAGCVSTSFIKPIPQNSDSRELSPTMHHTVDDELDVYGHTEVDDPESGSPVRLLPARDLSSSVAFDGPLLSTTVDGESLTAMVRSNESSEHHTNRHHHHDHLTSIMSETNSFTSLLRVILLLCAMSLHSLFEGLAVGLQITMQQTVSLFSAILLHKVIIAAGIGVNLATLVGQNNYRNNSSDNNAEITPGASVRSTYRLSQQLCGTLLLAFASPVGVICGLGLLSLQHSNGLILTTGVLQGLACGTFFYVVFCELLPEEFREGVPDRIGKLLFLLLGFLVIAGYSFVMPE